MSVDELAERRCQEGGLSRVRTRVLVITHEAVGARMAGQAIRYWELARALARHFEVILATPYLSGSLGPDQGLPTRPDPSSPAGEPEICRYARADPAGQTRLVELAHKWAHAVICSGDSLAILPPLRNLPVPLVADVYIPSALESLAWSASSAMEERVAVFEYSWNLSLVVARHADLLTCANDRQRDFWLGVLAAAGRLRPDLYALDPDLRNLVDVVPFGCPAERPQGGPALKGVHPGIGPDDRVILWGSGIWNWFDPLPLLRAMPQVLERHPEARLVFMGAAHPDPELVPEMAMARQTRLLSQELGLEGKHVFWLDWVPYAQRAAYLLEADVGVSLHRPGIEAHIAFRSRLLDAIWTGLPLVMAEGDLLSAELAAQGAGLTVPPADVDAVARAVSALLDEPDARGAREGAFAALRDKYAWDRVAGPLVRFCRQPYFTVERASAAQGLQPTSITPERGDWERERAAQAAEIARLSARLAAYERGRFIRLMAWLRSVRLGRLGRRGPANDREGRC